MPRKTSDMCVSAAPIPAAPFVLSDIVCRATTLQERLVTSAEPAVDPIVGLGLGGRLLKAWSGAVSPDDERGLDRRLSWLGLDRASAARRLNEPLVRTQPAWATTLRTFMQRVALAHGGLPSVRPAPL